MEEQELGVGRETVRSFSSMFTGTVASILVSLFIYVAVARLLGPSNYGVYTFAFGFGSLAIGIFGGFGVGNYLIKGITEARFVRSGEMLERILAGGYTVILAITAVLLVIGLAVSGIVAGSALNTGVDYIFLVIAVVSIFFGVLEAVSENALVGFGKAKLAVATMLTSDIIQLVVSVGLILAGYGVLGALIGLLASDFLGFLFAEHFVNAERKQYGARRVRLATSQEVRETVKFSAPIGMKNLLGNGLVNFAIVLLGLYVTRSMLGDYGVAMSGFSFIAAFYGNVTHVMLQSFTNARKAKQKPDLDKTYGLTLKYSLMFVLPIFVYMIVFANPGVYIIFSHSYTTAPFYLSLITAGVFINTISIYISTLFISANRTSKVLKYSLISAAIQFVLLLLLIPMYGPFGSIAVLFIIGSVINDILYIRGAGNTLIFNISRARVYRVIIANVLLGFIIALAFLFSSGIWTIVSGAVILVLVYPLLLAISKVVDKGDTERLRKLAHTVKWLEMPIAWFLRYMDLFINRIWGPNAL